MLTRFQVKIGQGPSEKCFESRRKVATTVAGRNEQEQGKER